LENDVARKVLNSDASTEIVTSYPLGKRRNFFRALLFIVAFAGKTK